ncbi:MAG: hypothetical protein ACT4OS_02700 [Acidimicrobiales bacterium]
MASALALAAMAGVMVAGGTGTDRDGRAGRPPDRAPSAGSSPLEPDFASVPPEMSGSIGTGPDGASEGERAARFCNLVNQFYLLAADDSLVAGAGGEGADGGVDGDNASAGGLDVSDDGVITGAPPAVAVLVDAMGPTLDEMVAVAPVSVRPDAGAAVAGLRAAAGGDRVALDVPAYRLGALALAAQRQSTCTPDDGRPQPGGAG